MIESDQQVALSSWIFNSSIIYFTSLVSKRAAHNSKRGIDILRMGANPVFDANSPTPTPSSVGIPIGTGTQPKSSTTISRSKPSVVHLFLPKKFEVVPIIISDGDHPEISFQVGHNSELIPPKLYPYLRDSSQQTGYPLQISLQRESVSSSIGSTVFRLPYRRSLGFTPKYRFVLLPSFSANWNSDNSFLNIINGLSLTIRNLHLIRALSYRFRIAHRFTSLNCSSRIPYFIVLGFSFRILYSVALRLIFRVFYSVALRLISRVFYSVAFRLIFRVLYSVALRLIFRVLYSVFLRLIFRVIDIQYDSDLKAKFIEVGVSEFYKYLPARF
ncbi:hypothetical protein LAZ67_X004750 [Cordylochernes scorpioides]|uniref:Uncharacterized protein n=1 Tax=Cordylochernes scorpioides TaxID=51811 RepID=A0ABY6LV65_9ARAC|nr:hypothetical protein LAZ67_X004750 [Cordylochernes scorpioides]